MAGDRISLFQREGLSLPSISQTFVAVMQRSDPQAPLFGFAVTHHVGNSPATGYFIDEYSCAGRNTLYHFDHRPTVAEVREKLEERLKGSLIPQSGSSYRGLGNVCQWPVQIAPGFGNDPLVQRRDSALDDGL